MPYFVERYKTVFGQLGLVSIEGWGSGGGGGFAPVSPVISSAGSSAPGGTWSYATAPAPAPTYSYTAPIYTPGPISAYAPIAITIAPAGYDVAGPLGEGGPYTPLDYPAMRFLNQSESLRGADLITAVKQSPLLLGLGALALFLLLKD